MSNPSINLPSPSVGFVDFIRDGVRTCWKGKPIKYTASLRAAPAIPSPVPSLRKFDEFSVDEEEWELLSELIAEVADSDGPIVEIGVLAGRTTQRIASVKRPSQKIVAVDNFCWNGWGLAPEEHWSLVKLSLGYLCDTGHVEIHKVDKTEFFESYDGPEPALVFADAMHDYEGTKEDLLWAKSVGAKIVCGHDYCEKFPGVIQIVDELGGPRRLAGSLFVL
ncbi:MAG: class I SAM-dependent methyltransferase [Planctomycetota bacterium]